MLAPPGWLWMPNFPSAPGRIFAFQAVSGTFPFVVLLAVVNHIALFLAVFTGSFLVLMALGQLMARPWNTNRLCAALLFFWTGVFLISVGLGWELFRTYAPRLYGLHVPLYYLAGPLFTAYLKGLLNRPADDDLHQILRFPGYLALLPFGLAVLIFLPSFLLPSEMKIAMFEENEGAPYLKLYYRVLVGVALLGLLSTGIAFLRLFLQLRIIDLIQRDSRTPALKHVRVLLLWTALTVPLAIVTQFLGDPLYRRCVVALVALGVLWSYLLDYRYPGFFLRIDREIREQRYTRTKLQNVDTNAIVAALERAMAEERLYADEDLSLERLAEVAGVHRAQLSEILNSVMGEDFRSYVNRFRVEAAKHLLAEELERSVLAVGYAVGFNSKTSFNRNFKALVGETPAEYRARVESA